MHRLSGNDCQWQVRTEATILQDATSIHVANCCAQGKYNDWAVGSWPWSQPLKDTSVGEVDEEECAELMRNVSCAQFSMCQLTEETITEFKVGSPLEGAS